ncbi:hypothetical protein PAPPERLAPAPP_01430 [Brevundimonas phage vB_BpoS-Papperlapapp]|nr:hypothetical protein PAPPERLAPAPP_01430 [Brevundimonas phage vB_BpoS-Papperlapapp]
MTSKLIEIRGPSAQEAEDGAWVVFHRREPGGLEHFIKASYYEGSYEQWGSTTPILGDNVAAVTAWADAMRALEAFTDEEDEAEEDEVETKGWEQGDRCDVPAHADRGEITTILPDTFADGFARAEVSLDCGGSVVVSVDDLDILYDEPEAARPY